MKLRYTFVTGLLLIVLFNGCGTRQVIRPPSQSQPPRRAVAKFIDGVYYDMTDNPAAALLSYQEALLYDSTYADIHLAIGMEYFRLGKKDLGILAVRQALRLDPAEPRALQIMAEYYLENNRLAEADTIFRRMITYDSTNTDAYFGRGMIAQQLRQYETAEKYYREVLQLDPAYDPRVYDFLGSMYLRDGEFEKGRNIYLKSLEVYKDNGLAYNRLGMIGEALGDTAAAMRYYTRAIQEAPGFREPVERLSRIYLTRQEWESAARLYRQALAADSSDIESWLDLGGVLVSMGEVDSAKVLYQRIRNDFPKDARADLILGRINLDEQNYIEAYKSFKPITEKFAESPDGWLECGRALLLADSVDRAVFYLKSALALDSDNFLGNYLAGTAYLQLGDNLEAVPFLEKALESVFDPERRLPIIGSLASAYDAIGRYQVADSLFQKALRLDPDNSTILNNYSYSLSLRNMKLGEALEMALRALEQEPENGSFLDTVGWIYYLQGDYSSAAAYLEKAWETRKTSAEVADHLGDVYAKLGKRNKAVEAWKNALRLDPGNRSIIEKIDGSGQ